MDSESAKPLKFPKSVCNKKTKAQATIYGKSQAYPFYRVCWRVAGRRRMKSFSTYSEAKQAAEEVVKDLGTGSQRTALTVRQAADALAAVELLQSLYQSTGEKVSLLTAVGEYVEAKRKLKTHALSDAVDKYLSQIATVKRVDLLQAVGEFIEARKRRTVAQDGKRPALSPEQHYLTSLWLKEFARSFPGHAVCDLKKEHLNNYMAAHAKASPKTRNERRGVVKMLLKWCVAQDYLSPAHRLFEATELQHEMPDPEEIDFYRPDEFKRLLERAAQAPGQPKDGEEPATDYRELLPALALAGLAGVRIKEIMRLTWEEVLRADGHIEVKALKAKTRSRRLIPVSPALTQWLEAHRGQTGPVWNKSYDMFHADFAALRGDLNIPDRRNGLRHAFVTYHFALHANENLTAMQAGNTPHMVHKHYKGLATRAEAEQWFNVCPAGVAEGGVPNQT